MQIPASVKTLQVLVAEYGTILERARASMANAADENEDEDIEDGGDDDDGVCIACVETCVSSRVLSLLCGP